MRRLRSCQRKQNSTSFSFVILPVTNTGRLPIVFIPNPRLNRRMRIGISIKFAAIGIFLASNPVFAAPPDDGSGTAAQVPFRLSAELGDRMQLSRNEINPGSVVKMQQPTPQAPAISYAGSPFADPYGTKSNSQAEEDPRAYLMETNVNWASWVGQFADRWY